MGFENATGLGVFTHYGVRKVDEKFGAGACDELEQWAEWTFNYDDLPTFGSTNFQYAIPANARILSAKLEIITAFTSTSTTTDLTVGLYTGAGAAIDAAGLLTAAHASQTTIAVVGAILDGSSGTAGALINNTIGAVAGEVVVTPSAADLLTGRARLIVTYLKAAV